MDRKDEGMGNTGNKKKGSTLVLTVIAMTFVSLMAVAIITLTLTNIRLKINEKKSQEIFYSADSIVDAIKAGIEDMSSVSAAGAYTSALSVYSSVLSGTSTSVEENYTKDFLTEMIEKLSGGTQTLVSGQSQYQYSNDVIRKYLTDVQRNCYSGTGEMVLENDTLILKGITAVYTDNSFTTKINTDIRIEVPAMTTETHSEYLDYAMIADDQIKIKGNSTKVNGNIYAGTVGRENTDTDDAGEEKTGILVKNSAVFDVEGENIITRGDIGVENTSKLTIAGSGSNSAEIFL